MHHPAWNMGIWQRKLKKTRSSLEKLETYGTYAQSSEYYFSMRVIYRCSETNHLWSSIKHLQYHTICIRISYMIFFVISSKTFKMIFQRMLYRILHMILNFLQWWPLNNQVVNVLLISFPRFPRTGMYSAFDCTSLYTWKKIFTQPLSELVMSCQVDDLCEIATKSTWTTISTITSSWQDNKTRHLGIWPFQYRGNRRYQSIF